MSTTTTATLSCVRNRMARFTMALASSSADMSGFFLVSCLMNVHTCELLMVSGG
jgi:hypothetical protein